MTVADETSEVTTAVNYEETSTLELTTKTIPTEEPSTESIPAVEAEKETSDVTTGVANDGEITTLETIPTTLIPGGARRKRTADNATSDVSEDAVSIFVLSSDGDDDTMTVGITVDGGDGEGGGKLWL